MLNTMATMVQQMTETIRVQNEERNLWRQNSSTKAQADIKDHELQAEHDATTVADLELRNVMRPLNMKPEVYWKSFDRIAKPCLESVENGHISTVLVNPKVVKKMHDRYVLNTFSFVWEINGIYFQGC